MSNGQKIWRCNDGKLIVRDGKLIRCTDCPEPPVRHQICDLHIVFSGYIDYFLWSSAPETDTVVTTVNFVDFGFDPNLGGDAPATCSDSACFSILWDSSSTCAVTGSHITSSSIIAAGANLTIYPVVSDFSVSKQHSSDPDYSLRFTADVQTKCKCWGYVPTLTAMYGIGTVSAHGQEFWTVTTLCGKVPGEGSVTLSNCTLLEDELE